MVTEDQTEVVEFLSSASTHGGAAVERIETHASIVFLAGAKAWKLKRAVRYDYLDFSTPERRRAMCAAEVRINRRTAPALYRGMVAVTRTADGSLRLGGEGVALDWLVEMSRFDQENLFDRLAVRGLLDADLMRPLAAGIARFHLDAERRLDHGGRAGMAWVIDGNDAGFAEHGAAMLDPALCTRVTAEARRALERHGDLLETRRSSGFVRQCHGDLHLRNIVLIDGSPTLFDAIEFNDEIACTDVLYDLAFLVMDLCHRRLTRHANVLWNSYLGATGDFEGVPLMPLFLSCRAAVRAKTSATAAHLQTEAARRSELQGLARDYVAMALDLLRPPPPCLIAVGGFSGSGKSQLAQALAPHVGAVPGAVVLRSDEIRKRLCGVEPLARLGPEGYSPDASRRVYAAAAERAGVLVRGGHAAIADAVFGHPADREAMEHVAAAAGVPFVGLWLDAPESMLIARSAQRHLDPSDADADVIRRQHTEGTGSIRWNRIDASSTLEQVRRAAAAVLSGRLDAHVVRVESLIA